MSVEKSGSATAEGTAPACIAVAIENSSGLAFACLQPGDGFASDVVTLHQIVDCFTRYGVRVRRFSMWPALCRLPSGSGLDRSLSYAFSYDPNQSQKAIRIKEALREEWPPFLDHLRAFVPGKCIEMTVPWRKRYGPPPSDGDIWLDCFPLSTSGRAVTLPTLSGPRAPSGLHAAPRDATSTLQHPGRAQTFIHEAKRDREQAEAPNATGQEEIRLNAVYTSKEACRLLRKSYTTLWRHMRLGKLHPQKNERHKKFTGKELLRYLADGASDTM